MYQSGGTIKSLLDKVSAQELLLPAIQREFVWKPEQIYGFFDSILQGYPFGTFLYWKILPANRSDFQFYEIMRDYHVRDHKHCNRVDNAPEREFTAVLDGQQRITALNIGLCGSYTWKVKGRRWADDSAFPRRFLFLNLLSKADEETGSRYEFKFLPEENSGLTESGEYWFRVNRIFEADEDVDVKLVDEVSDNKALRDTVSQDEFDSARFTLRLLYKSIHDKDKISYYEETDQNIDKVLSIFIRMNSGGTELSYSDLLLSIAVAQWENLDAREEIHNLVDDMNEIGHGFNVSKDLVLKAGLMLSDVNSVSFKVENFTRENMGILENNWTRVKEALLLTMKIFANFGFNSQNLRAASSIIPVAYYVYLRGLDDSYLTRTEYVEDRQKLHNWLTRSLLKVSGIWGSGLDQLLTVLRADIREYGENGFPTEMMEKSMTRRGKSLVFEEEEIEELVELEFGNPRTILLLTMLFPGYDLSRQFHIDHIYPKSKFTIRNLSKLEIAEELHYEMMLAAKKLPNLQLLEGPMNLEKQQSMPHVWFEKLKPDLETRNTYLGTHAIEVLPENLSQFMEFYETRKRTLIEMIQRMLNPN